MSAGTEIAHRREGGAVATTPSDTIPMEQQLAMIREALTNPEVDPGKAREMFLLMREMQRDAQKAEFNRAKMAAIRAMPAIYKRGTNTHLNVRYAKFEDLHRAAMPVLFAHDLTLDFRIGRDGQDVTVQPILSHRNGYTEEGGVMAAPASTGGNKAITPVMAVAITASYLKRHSMKAMLNIIEDGEDTDGVLRPETLLNDRQQELLVQAQEAADEGRYEAWFRLLSSKDKAVVIGSGTHARLGGAPALPGASTGGAGQAERRTPEQMVEAYEGRVRACEDLDALRTLQTEERTASWTAGLKARHPELHQRVVDANERRFGELGGGQG